MSIYSRIDKIAKIQNGVITKSELLNLGMSISNIESLRKNIFLRNVAKGIYVICGSKDTWLQRATIQTKRFEDSYLSHESVLHLYKIFDYKFDQQRFSRINNNMYTRHLIHILTSHKYFRDNNTYVHKTKCILDKDLNNFYHGIKHVSLERAIIDSSVQLNDHELSYAIEKSIRMRISTLNHFSEAIFTLGEAPGRETSRILKILDRMTEINLKPSIESYFETMIENIISPISKYKLRRQYKLNTPGKNIRVDFAILELRIIIEADGYDHHGGRLAYDKDKMRYAYLQSQGWIVLGLTTNMTKQTIRKLFLDMQKLRMSDSALTTGSACR